MEGQGQGRQVGRQQEGQQQQEGGQGREAAGSDQLLMMGMQESQTGGVRAAGAGRTGAISAKSGRIGAGMKTGASLAMAGRTEGGMRTAGAGMTMAGATLGGMKTTGAGTTTAGAGRTAGGMTMAGMTLGGMRTGARPRRLARTEWAGDMEAGGTLGGMRTGAGQEVTSTSTIITSRGPLAPPLVHHRGRAAGSRRAEAGRALGGRWTWGEVAHGAEAGAAARRSEGGSMSTQVTRGARLQGSPATPQAGASGGRGQGRGKELGTTGGPTRGAGGQALSLRVQVGPGVLV